MRYCVYCQEKMSEKGECPLCRRKHAASKEWIARREATHAIKMFSKNCFMKDCPCILCKATGEKAFIEAMKQFEPGYSNGATPIDNAFIEKITFEEKLNRRYRR